MKVKELREMLNNMDPRQYENEVCVEVVRKGSMGGTPTVRVRSGFNGFDWDSGRFILHTFEPVMEIKKEDKRDIIIDDIID